MNDLTTYPDLIMMVINFNVLQSKYFNNIVVIKIFALKNFKINDHQNVSRAFNILHYDLLIARKYL